MLNKQELIYSLMMFLVLFLAAFIMWPALTGPFIFDDFPNLKPLGNNGGVYDWDSFWVFLNSGDAGQLGRPISLLSFLINDQSWPSNPENWRYTNVMLHLLNGVLMFFLLLKLLPLIAQQKDYRKFLLPAFVVFSYWVLHPLQQSPVFLIIQRMTLLAATFTILTLLLYIVGRSRENIVSQLSFLAMSFVMFLCGIFSKETAAVSILFVCLVEIYCFPSPKKIEKYNFDVFVRSVLMFGVVIFISVLLYYGIKLSGQGRNFDALERLMTEGRVVLEYQRIILLPSMPDLALYHEIQPSKTLLNPVSTIFSWAFHIIVICIAWVYRYKLKLISFGVFWFYLGHAGESTILNLELFFNHRNYLPLLGIGLILIGLIQYHNRIIRMIAVGCLVISFSTGQLVGVTNAKVWASKATLLQSWLKDQPDSYRNKREWAYFLYEIGEYEESYLSYIEVAEQHKDMFMPFLDAVVYACNFKVKAPFSAELLTKLKAVETPIVNVAHGSLEKLVEFTKAGACIGIDYRDIIGVLEAYGTRIKSLPKVTRQLIFRETAAYYAQVGEFETAIGIMQRAWTYDKKAEYKYFEALYLAASGKRNESMSAIREAKSLAEKASLKEVGELLTHLEGVLLNEQSEIENE